MASKPKFYVVWQGRSPGVYTSWADCQKQVHRFPGARFKSFPTRSAAEAALANRTPTSKPRPGARGKKPAGRSIPTRPTDAAIDQTALSVDGACRGNPGPMEYRAVWVGSREEVFKVGPMHGTNNLGEFLALVDALRFFSERGDTTTAIYTDSLTARAWVRNKKAKTTMARTPKTEEVWKLTDEAIAWLKANPVSSPIKVWNTKVWGEIPADFGRK